MWGSNLTAGSNPALSVFVSCVFSVSALAFVAYASKVPSCEQPVSWGLEAIYPKRRTSVPGAGHKIYPYLLRNVAVTRPNQCANIFVRFPVQDVTGHFTPVDERLLPPGGIR